MAYILQNEWLRGIEGKKGNQTKGERKRVKFKEEEEERERGSIIQIRGSLALANNGYQEKRWNNVTFIRIIGRKTAPCREPIVPVLYVLILLSLRPINILSSKLGNIRQPHCNHTK